MSWRRRFHLREERRGALREELTLLERMVERTFTDVEDRKRASVADQQGLGASLPDGGA